MERGSVPRGVLINASGRCKNGAGVGSSIGAAVGFSILGPIGSFLGSFVGDLAGTLLGDLFGHDPHPTSYASAWLDPATHGFLVEPGSFGGYDGGDPATLIHIAEYQSGELNTLLALSGAQVDWHWPTTSPATITDDYPVLRLSQRDHFYMMSMGPTAVAQININNANDLASLVDPGVMALAHSIHLAGGDPLVRLAWDHSHAANASAFALTAGRCKNGAPRCKNGAGSTRPCGESSGLATSSRGSRGVLINATGRCKNGAGVANRGALKNGAPRCKNGAGSARELATRAFSTGTPLRLREPKLAA
jgi:hypothetical protein